MSDLYKNVESILSEKGMTFKELSKRLGIKESVLIENLNRETWGLLQSIYFMDSLAKEMGVDVKRLHERNIQDDIEIKVKDLIKRKGISFVELAKRIGYTNAGLHRSFANKNINLATLDIISNELDVDISYFFEAKVIDRLRNEISKYKENPDQGFYE